MKAYLDWLKQSFDWSKDVLHKYDYPDGRLKDRIIKHDIVHLLIIGQDRKRPIRLKFTDEYANAIVQAVLEGTAQISRRAASDAGQGEERKHQDITEDAIRKITIPKTVEFLKRVLTESDMTLPENFKTDVSSEFINEHIQVGKNFRRNFKDRYGIEFVSMDINTFLTIPFSELQSLYATAKEHALSGADHARRP